MTRIDPYFSRNAYMLEFKIGNNIFNLDNQCFTFSLPPESEQIANPQRVSYTKTFGGVIVDDYGNDVRKITLSGTTGNGDEKTIFRGFTRPPILLTGEDELLYLDKLIEKYGKTNKLVGKKIYLYDLSKFSLKNLLTSPNYWQVNIDSFKYSRDKSRPTFYKYTLEMTAYRPKMLFDLIEVDNISDILDVINTIIDVTLSLFSFSSAIVDTLTILDEEIQNYISVYNNYQNLIMGFSDDVRNVVELVTRIGNWSLKNESGENTASIDTNDSNVDLKNAADSVKKATDNAVETVDKTLENISSGDLESLLNANNLTAKDELITVIESMLDDLLGKVDSLVAATKKLQKVSYYKGIIYYGLNEVTIKSTDSYESLSQQYYGTIDFADKLAIFNEGKQLKTGETVFIPILDASKSIAGNNVVRPENDNCELGKDIRLSDDGDLCLNNTNGDIAIVEGTKNLQQATNSRLQTEMGTRIRDNVYGIRSVIGNTEAITSYLYSSIEQTLLDDPRIEEVEKIEFVGKGEQLYYEVTFISKAGETENIGGTL